MIDYQMDWPRSSSCVLPSGCIRSKVEDFQVDEISVLSPSGEGEHLWLQVKKSQLNTMTVTRELAKAANVPVSSVSFAGLKDKYAITTQWFSIWLPGKELVLADSQFNCDIEILQQIRHDKKLKRGMLKGNRFTIVVRQLKGDGELLRHRFEEVGNFGVPNYFGQQRFGNNGSNLKQIAAVLRGELKIKGRQQRSILYSAMRSWLFNQILAERINQQIWLAHIQGDVFMLDGSHSVFVDEGNQEEYEQRLADCDIHLTAPLYGAGSLMAVGEAAKLEKSVLDQYPEMTGFLEARGLKISRRALRLVLQSPEINWLAEDVVELKFSLPAGGYATSVLTELFNFDEFNLKDQS